MSALTRGTTESLPHDKHAEALVWHLTPNIWTLELYLAKARLFFLCWVLDPGLILVSAVLVYKRLQPPSCSAQGAAFQGAEAETFWGELPWRYPCCFNAHRDTGEVCSNHYGERKIQILQRIVWYLLWYVSNHKSQILIQNLTSYQARTKNLSLESSSQLNEAETRQPMLLSSWEKNKIKGWVLVLAVMG